MFKVRSSLSVVLSVSMSFVSSIANVKAGTYTQVIEWEGQEYCIGTSSGTYYFSGTGVDGFGPNITRARYSEFIPVPRNEATNKKGTKGKLGNQNHWTLGNSFDSPWIFQGYNKGASNDFAKHVSGRLRGVKVASGIGVANRLRGFLNGIHQEHVKDNLVQEYDVPNVARRFDMSECVDDESPMTMDLIVDQLSEEFGGGEDSGAYSALITALSGNTPDERRKRLGEVFSALLVPRNVIAAGGLATQAFSNDLADTILEQLPTRYLMEVEEEVVVEIDDVEAEEEVVPTREPVRGLWMKDGEVDDAQASDYLDKTVIASASQSTDALEIGGINYVEDQDPRSIYLNGGMRAWVKGFAGSMSPFSTGGLEKNGIYYPDVYNDFYSTHGGVVVGVDAPVADKVQVGVFGHYGSISLNHFAGEFTGNGSWNPSGWGGGLTASYVDKGFYVQGLFGATSFSGENKRQVLLGGVIDETYTATKNTTSYVGAVRVGAPVLWGGVIVDPQLTATWNGNNDASYTESGRYDALALKVKSYSDHFLQTALGSKFSWPIPYDNGNLLTPSLRVAWLADWNTNNGDVSYQRANAENPTTAKIPSNQEMENGVLLEGGVDYAIFGGESSSWMLYAKGGAKIWFSKSADWRASGGVTFRF